MTETANRFVVDGVYRTHGYASYTGGCRCATCRAAKAEYMSAKRHAASRDRQSSTDPAGYIAPGITHGTYAGYADSGCRCGSCKAAKAGADRKARTEAGRMPIGIAVPIAGLGLFAFGWTNSCGTPNGWALLAIAVVGLVVLLFATGIVRYRALERADAARTEDIEKRLQQNTSTVHYLDGA